MLRVCSTLMIAATLTACGSKPPPPAPPPVKDTAFGDMVGTMDKARGVEATQMQHKEDMDRAIDKGD